MNKIVSRHSGAINWLRSKGIEGEVVPQLTLDQVQPGDIIFGNLPVELINACIAKGARVIILSLPAIAFGQRGAELTPAEMDAAGAKLLEVVSLQLKEVKQE